MASQGQSNHWTLEDERAFIENLVCQRFNFLLVFFGLIVAGAVSAQNRTLALVVLWLGVAVMWALAVTVAAAHWKLQRILAIICTDDPQHPIAIISAQAGHRRINWLIGYVVPAFCAVALLLGAVLGTACVLPLGDS